MIQQLTIRGLGPHDALDLSISPGETTIHGASESGKTSLIEAVCFVLFGKTARGKRFPTAQIRDGATTASVELRLSDGRSARRTIDRQRPGTRSVDGRPASTEVAFLQHLGLPDPEVARVVIVPLAWVELAATNARPLRDLLTRVLPEGDVAAEVTRRLTEAGHAIVDASEARMEARAVEKVRREIRRDRDRASGRVDALAAQLEGIGEVALPEPAADVDTLLAHHRLWEAHDLALAEHARREQGRKDALARAMDFDARRVALGEAPSPVGDALVEAQRVERASAAALSKAREAWRGLKDRFHRAEAKLHDLEGATAGACPTCGAAWEKGRRAAAQARGVVEGLDLEREELEDRGRAARQASEAARVALEQAREADLARSGWERAMRALGMRPKVPEELASPVAPAVPRPDPGTLAPALARGAAMERSRERGRVAKALDSARVEHRRLEGEATRLDALLEAVRGAPSAVAARQAAALGDLGPVSLHFGDSPAVEVRVDGRPWWLASRGRLVVADVWLRAALRRVSGLSWPIFVDNVQDVAGQPLPSPGSPVVWLRTTEGALRVQVADP